MSEQMARALGANGSLSIKIAGKDCVVRPLGVKDLTEVERDCVQKFKRQYLQTYASNIDLFPVEIGQQMLRDKMDEVAKWDVGDLPPKFAYNPHKLVVNDKVKEWLKVNFDVAGEQEDKRWRTLTAAVLDQGSLSEEDYESMTDTDPIKVKVGYVNWWITGCYDGMLTFVWICFRQYGVTRSDCEEVFSGDFSSLVDFTREIERLSEPQAGNG